jgi:Response regulators consisting of a CheY-like receiver domain and a winged-helix DNA-binding domain
MSYPILSVDRDLEVFQREQAGWEQHSIAVKRVNDMCEALAALDGGDYLFVSINADNIDYLPMLPMMCKATATPIFVITSSFTIKEQVMALHAGAAVYAPFQENVETNIISALAVLDSYNQHVDRPVKPKMVSYHKIILFPEHGEAFYGNGQISLSDKQFRLLHYLMVNKGITLTKSQIYQHLWELGYEEKDLNALWNQIKRLRKRIETATGVKKGYIVTIPGIGYKMPL